MTLKAEGCPDRGVDFSACVTQSKQIGSRLLKLFSTMDSRNCYHMSIDYRTNAPGKYKLLYDEVYRVLIPIAL
jgi:hypothetical protein